MAARGRTIAHGNDRANAGAYNYTDTGKDTGNHTRSSAVAHGHSGPDGRSHPRPYGRANLGPDRHSYAHGHAGAHTYPDTDGYSGPHTYAQTHGSATTNPGPDPHANSGSRSVRQ